MSEEKLTNAAEAPEGRQLHDEEKVLGHSGRGMVMLFVTILLFLAVIPLIVGGVYMITPPSVPQIVEPTIRGTAGGMALGVVMIIAGVLCVILGIFSSMGLKVMKPNEALVLTLFGKYYGTLKKEGYYWVNPFTEGVNPTVTQYKAEDTMGGAPRLETTPGKVKSKGDSTSGMRISMKAITLDNRKQKINDKLGNPIEIGIVVIWRVVNTAKAVFNVDNYMEFLSIQADSALRNIVRLYPYDLAEDRGDECTLRGSSQEVAEKLKAAIQEKVDIAGLEVLEARITHLAYAPEIAAAMLQRQQAAAIVDARRMIVDGAVGMVEMALEKLEESQKVTLDEERKAAMVSNLLVVLCGNKDAQPVVNSGSLY